MRVFINPGHDRERDSGAVNPNTGLRECDVAAAIGSLVQTYLETAGCEVQLLQSDNLAGETPDLPCVVDTANTWPADVFVSLHCNADSGCACGTETLVYANDSGSSPQLAACIQSQIVQSLERRGVTVLIKGIQLRHEDLFRTVGVLAALRHHKHLFDDLPAAITHARSHVRRQTATA